MSKLGAIAVMFAWMLVFGSALGAIWSKHQARTSFVELQRLQAERDRLDIEWGQLKLEQSYWSTHGRVEQVARADLKMTIPQPQTVHLVRTAMPVDRAETP
ncbi:MAG: cell division protein FtsL [Candidatus Obscuribacterales bacterium]|nr:cell division protein FtsL [Steroidobacteraceae bacterium]